MRPIVLLILLFNFTVLHAEEINPNTVIKDTISLLVSGKTKEAFEYVIGTNPYFVENKLEVETTKVKFVDYVSSVGTPSSCEPFASKTIIKRYRKDMYICLSERQPFEIHFTFYKQKDHWMIENFSYSSDIDDLMDHLMEKELSK